MKNSNSQIFNSSRKTYFNSFKTGFSITNNNSTYSKKSNNSLSSIKFPKILQKIKNSRKSNLKIRKDNTRYYDNNNTYQGNTRKSFKDLFNIINYTNNDTKPVTINNRLTFTDKHKENTKNTDMQNTLKSLTKFYIDYQNTKSENYYDTIFLKKSRMTDYKKSLSCDYEKDNRTVIDMATTKFKQKNDSILNVVNLKDGFYIKGLKYKKYFFFPHKKMNILAFHNNIMNNNVNIIKKRNIDDFKKIKTEKKIKKSKSTYIDNDVYNFISVYQKNNNRHWTKNFFIRKKVKENVEKIVDNEINNVINNNNKNIEN